jgi:hypothetical protein
MPSENLATGIMPPPPGAEPGDINPLASDQTTFEGRMPDPTEVVRWGGSPGCRYAFITADRYDHFAESGWELPSPPVRTITVKGPTGSCRVMIVVQGKPIPGADPLNGIRPWSYDPTIKDRTGLTELFPTEIKLAAKPGPDNPAGPREGLPKAKPSGTANKGK